MKINKKMKATLLVGLSSSLVLASVPLLNSNVLTNTKDNAALSISAERERERAADKSKLDPTKITVGTEGKFGLDVKKIGLFAPEAKTNPAVNSPTTGTGKPSFWLDQSDNTINLDTTIEVPYTSSTDTATDTAPKPKITITVKNKGGTDPKEYTIESTKKDSIAGIEQKTANNKMVWVAPKTEGDSGWQTVNETAGGSSNQLNSKPGTEDTSAKGTKFKLTLTDGQTADIKLSYGVSKTESTPNKNLKYVKKATAGSAKVANLNAETYTEVSKLNIAGKDGKDIPITTAFNTQKNEYKMHENYFAMSAEKKDAAKPEVPPQESSRRSRRDTNSFKNPDSSTTKAESTIVYPTNSNYSQKTIDDSTNIRNLQIDWENLWKNNPTPDALHKSLTGKTGGKTPAGSAAANILTFNKVNKDSEVKITNADGWVDTESNSYSLKYSGTVTNGWNLENLYNDNTYKVPSADFNHLITFDFNSKGITRTDLNKATNAIPSYVFDVAENKTTRNNSQENPTKTNDPYAVIPTKNPQKIGLIASSNSGNTSHNLAQEEKSLSAWVDQNGLNIDTLKVVSGGAGDHDKTSISYTIKYSDSKKPNETKVINIPKKSNAGTTAPEGEGPNIFEPNNQQATAKYFGWRRKQIIETGHFVLTKDEESKGGETSTPKPKGKFLLPLTSDMSSIEVTFKYIDFSSTTSTTKQAGGTNTQKNSMLQYLDGSTKDTGGSAYRSAATPESKKPLKDAATDLKIKTKDVTPKDEATPGQQQNQNKSLDSKQTGNATPKNKILETKVILYRGADGMNHMLWDTNNKTNDNSGGESGGEKPILFNDTKTPSAETHVKSDYSINTSKLAQKIKELTAAGRTIDQIMNDIKTSPEFGQTIEVKGRMAPHIAITMSADQASNSIKFNVDAKKIDATGIVEDTSSKNPMSDYKDVLINGEQKPSFYINNKGETSTTPFPSENEGFPTWAIAVIAVSAVVVVGLAVFAFIKLRQR